MTTEVGTKFDSYSVLPVQGKAVVLKTLFS